MSRYNQYGSYYDPVGSQPSQPSGYTYQAPSSSSSYPSGLTSSAYGSNYQNYGGNSYGNQQYGTSSSQQPSSSASHAAEALNSLSGQNYGQTTSANRTDSNNQYSSSTWSAPGTNSSAYTGTNLALANRTQANNSPIYSQAHASSAFGRKSVPEQTQNSSNTFGASQTYQNAPSSAGASSRYQSAYTQPQGQPPRYNSPLHAVQAQQHGHTKQGSRGSSHLPSPQLAQTARVSQQNRQQSSSVEPSPTTVDPSQVYDNRAELQRKAQIEAERRQKQEAELATKRAEEERIAAEKQKEEEKKQKREEEEAAAAARKKSDQDRKNEQRRKAREEKKQSKSAATALQRMASGMAESSGPPANEEEAEMRAMFKKMREFNAKNPSMLAKLWDEERKSHEAGKPSPAATSRTPTAVSPTAASGAVANKAQQQSAAQTAAKPTAQSKSLNAMFPSIPGTTQPSAVQQTAAVAGPANTSLWPPHKKGTLAEATAKWLMSLPQNAGKTISREAVLNILNGNPAYVQLCESLEAFGVKFERSSLARELLRAVPDGLKAQSATGTPPLFNAVKSATPHSNGASTGSPDMGKKKGRSKRDEAVQRPGGSSTAAPATVSYEAPLSLADAAREVNSMDRTVFQHVYGSPPQQSQQSPYFTQPQALANHGRPPSQSQAPEVKQENKVAEPPRPPADKEEAARKRTFGDLVDLTAEDSDDEAPPPKKMMQPQTAPVNGDNTLQQPVAFSQFMLNPGGTFRVPTPGMKFPPPAPSAQMAPPSQAPVQQQSQNGMPQSVQQLAVQLPNKQKGPTAEQLQQARMKGKMLVEPIMRDRVARKSNYDSRTIARDVLLATGRHPDMRGLNAHLVNMQRLLGAHGGESDSAGNRADLSTIKWDIIDPEPPNDAKKSAEGEAATTSVEPPTPRTAAAIRNTVNYDTPDLGFKPKKRKGRPPRSSLPNATGSTPLTDGLGASTNTPRPTSSQTSTSRPATPSSAPTPATTNMASGTSAVGYAAFAQFTAEGKKKKGRPFGWRKEVHSRGAQGLPKAQAASTKGIPGRPKLATPSKQEQVQPHYQVYKCEWAGCSSELHNLDTLKKHLVKVHGHKDEDDEEYVCLWKDCRDGKAERFEDIEGWINHVDTEHLQPVAWKLGDGPKAGVVSETSHYYSSPSTPAYLSDRYGRSVTPVITPTVPAPSIPQEHTMTAPQSSNKDSEQPETIIKRRGRPPKDGIPKTGAGAAQAQQNLQRDTELKKLGDHLRAVGPTLERMGCVLASEERRGTFLDDEDFEDEVYGSEYDGGDE